MIPFLLHARAPGGAPPPGTTLITPPTWDGYWNVANRYSLTAPASAVAGFVLRADGSWEFPRSPGAAATGFWTTAPAAGVGAGFECRFTILGGEGVPTSTINQASDWVSLSTDRLIQITQTRSTVGASASYIDFLAEIRPTGGVAIGGEATLDVYVEIG